jgi:hypothetical protein
MPSALRFRDGFPGAPWCPIDPSATTDLTRTRFACREDLIFTRGEFVIVGRLSTRQKV